MREEIVRDGYRIIGEEVAKARSDTNPSLYKLHGRILLMQKKYDRASSQFEIALMYNPFDHQLAQLLAESEARREQFDNALRSTIHAFILLRDRDRQMKRDAPGPPLRELPSLRDAPVVQRADVDRIDTEAPNAHRRAVERERGDDRVDA